MSQLSLESQVRLGVDLAALGGVVGRVRFDLHHSFPRAEEVEACERVLVALDALLGVLAEVDGAVRIPVDEEPFGF